MKQIFSFILGVMLSIGLVAFAQTTGVTVFKPVMPKEIYVKVYEHGEAYGIKKDIYGKVKLGFVVKSITSVSRDYTTILVMERY